MEIQGLKLVVDDTGVDAAFAKWSKGLTQLSAQAEAAAVVMTDSGKKMSKAFATTESDAAFEKWKKGFKSTTDAIDDAKFAKWKQDFDNLSKSIKEGGDGIEGGLKKVVVAADKTKSALDITGAASKFSTAGRSLDTLGITDGFGDLANGAYLAVNGLESLGTAFVGMSPVIAAVAATLLVATFAVSKLKDAYEGATPAQKALNTELEKSAKGYQDSAQGLVELAGVTRDQAKAALEAAATDKSYALELKKLADEAQPVRSGLQEVSARFSELGETAKQAMLIIGIGWAGMAATIGGLALGKSIEKIREEFKGFLQVGLVGLPADEGKKEALAENIVAKERAKIRLATLNEQLDSVKKYQKDFAKETQDGANRVKGIDKDLSSSLVDIEYGRKSQVASIRESSSQQYQSITRGLNRQLEQMEKQWERQLVAFARQEEQIAEDLASSLAQIEEDSAKESLANAKDLKKALAREDKNTAKSLRDVDENLQETIHNSRSARSRREARKAAKKQKEDILEAAAERKADLEEASRERAEQYAEQKAERIADTLEASNQRKIALAEQIAIAREQVEYNKAQAREQAEYQKKEAARVAAYQIEQARIASEEQIRLAKGRAVQEKLIEIQKMVDIALAFKNNILGLGNVANNEGLTVGASLVAGIVAGINKDAALIRAAIQSAIVFAGVKGTATVGPSMHSGGPIPASAPYNLLAGEYVLNRQQVAQFAPLLGGANNSKTYNFSHIWNGPASDFDKNSIAAQVKEATYKAIQETFGA